MRKGVQIRQKFPEKQTPRKAELAAPASPAQEQEQRNLRDVVGRRRQEEDGNDGEFGFRDGTALEKQVLDSLTWEFEGHLGVSPGAAQLTTKI